jgi:hypothetical protein
MLTYGFYNSVAGDRTYSAEQMSSIFEGMIHDGVFEDIDDKLMVEVSAGMNIKVGTGRAWFNQTWTKNDSDITLTVDAAEVVLKRIDVVVLEVDAAVESRENSIKIVKGTPGSSPVAPTLTNAGDVHQYPLAHIFVDASVVEIIEGNITNKVGTVDCPYVKGVLRSMDTEDFAALSDEFDDLLEAFEALETSINDAGRVSYYAMSTAPTGHLKANGAAVLIATYGNLTTNIYCGDGNNATAPFGYKCTNPANPTGTRSTAGTYITLPDLRGVFTRGWVDDGSYDSGRAFGSYQGDDVKAHGHTFTTGSSGSHSHGASTYGGSFANGEVFGCGHTSYPVGTATTGSAGAHTHTGTTDNNGSATETKVKNVALLACIKY